MDWIEQLFGVAPDHGNGTLEAFITAVAVGLVAVLLLRGYLAVRRSGGRRPVAANLPAQSCAQERSAPDGGDEWSSRPPVVATPGK